jgi:hypothetical protein
MNQSITNKSNRDIHASRQEEELDNTMNQRNKRSIK